MARTISVTEAKKYVRVDGDTFDTEIQQRVNEAAGIIIDAGITEDKFTITTENYTSVNTGYDSVDIKIIGLIYSYVKVMFGYDENDVERDIPVSWNTRLTQAVKAFDGRELNA